MSFMVHNMITCEKRQSSEYTDWFLYHTVNLPVTTLNKMVLYNLSGNTEQKKVNTNKKKQSCCICECPKACLTQCSRTQVISGPKYITHYIYISAKVRGQNIVVDL